MSVRCLCCISSVHFIAACVCVWLFVCVCWSWQLLIVILISWLQFLADVDKLSLTLRFPSFSHFLLLLIFPFLPFFPSPLLSFPLISPSCPAHPPRPLVLHRHPLVFLPSLARVLLYHDSCYFLLRCHLLVLFSSPCLWHLHVCTATPHSFIIFCLFPVLLTFHSRFSSSLLSPHLYLTLPVLPPSFIISCSFSPTFSHLITLPPLPPPPLLSFSVFLSLFLVASWCRMECSILVM